MARIFTRFLEYHLVREYSMNFLDSIYGSKVDFPMQ